MGGFSPKNIGVKVLVMGILLLATSLPVPAQIFQITNTMPKTGGEFWKMMYEQNWDMVSDSWGDTVSVSSFSGGTNRQPAEMFSKSKSEHGIWKNTGKSLLSYENGKVKIVSEYTYDTVTSTYDSTPMGQLKLTWSGDLVSKFELEGVIDDLIKEEFDLTLVKTLIGSSYIAKVFMEMTAKIENGKIVEELTRTKLSVNPVVFPLVKSMLSEYGLPADTNWNDISKSVVTYGTANVIYTNYDYIKVTNTWNISSKDSLVLNGEKIIKTISSKYDSLENSWELSTKDSSVYGSKGELTESVSLSWQNNTWINTSRALFLYNPGAAVRFSSKAEKPGMLKAHVSTGNNHPVINFTVDKNSTVIIQLCDLQGKSIGTPLKNYYPAGMHSVTLKNVSQGKYICKIQTDNTSAAIPFQVVR